MSAPMLDGGQGRDAPEVDAVWQLCKWIGLIVLGWFVLMFLGGRHG